MNSLSEPIANPVLQISSIVACCTIAYYWRSGVPKDTLSSASINLIRIFSRLQLCGNHMFKGCKYLASVVFCCPHDESMMDNTYAVLDGKELSLDEDNFDMVIREVDVADGDTVNRFFIRGDCAGATKQFVPVASSFFVANITHNGIEHTIDGLDSHSIEGAILFDRPHVQWLLCKFHNKNIYDDDYSVSLLTTNLKQILLTSKACVRLTKTGFKVLGESDLKINLEVCEEQPVWRNLSEADITGVPENNSHSSNSSDSSYEMVN